MGLIALFRLSSDHSGKANADWPRSVANRRSPPSALVSGFLFWGNNKMAARRFYDAIFFHLSIMKWKTWNYELTPPHPLAPKLFFCFNFPMKKKEIWLQNGIVELENGGRAAFYFQDVTKIRAARFSLSFFLLYLIDWTRYLSGHHVLRGAMAYIRPLTEFYWVLLGFTGFYRVLLGFT